MTDWDAESTLVVRPRRVRLVAVPVAVLLIVVFTVVALLLRNTPTGVYFHTSDQVAMVFIGVLLAAGVLLFTRPRLRAGAEGIEVRNIARKQYYRWSAVEGISFPDGASWARLELPHDEYVTIMAIHSSDKASAVAAIRALRALHKKARSHS